MNHIKTIAVALLVAALPFGPAAFASDRGHDDRGHGRPDHARGHGYGHDHYGHHKHHYHHGHHGHHHAAGHYNDGGYTNQVMLPFPPLPPFPVIVLNKKHHGAQLELRHPY